VQLAQGCVIQFDLITSHQANLSQIGGDLAERFIEEANKDLPEQGTSLEVVQTHILLSIANYGIGDGRACWHGLGNELQGRANIRVRYSPCIRNAVAQGACSASEIRSFANGAGDTTSLFLGMLCT
jgi:hypothetical protein